MLYGDELNSAPMLKCIACYHFMFSLFVIPRTHQYPDLLLSVPVNYHVAGAGDAYVSSESIFCKTPLY